MFVTHTHIHTRGCAHACMHAFTRALTSPTLIDDAQKFTYDPAEGDLMSGMASTRRTPQNAKTCACYNERKSMSDTARTRRKFMDSCSVYNI